jgi:hypothetical protein
MRSPIAKLAAAAVIIAAVVLGLLEFIGSGSSSGIVWAEVARKVQTSQGVIFRQMADRAASEYSVNYLSATRSRKDVHEGGEITVSHYLDLEAMTGSSVYHTQKHYWRDAPLTERNAQAHNEMTDPKHLVDSILSCEHKKLGRRTIEGVLCEGLETTDPAVLSEDLLDQASNIEICMQLWVGVETDYPVLCEGHVTATVEGQTRTSEWVLDQFEWDAELEPGLFEPDVPADYEEI